MHHSDFIPMLFSALGCKTYLELGVYEGETIKKMKDISEFCACVDTRDFHMDGVTTFRMTTEQFFADIGTIYRGFFDMIFIDADHRFEAVNRDFNFSLDLLRSCGTIILHDTDPAEKRLLDFGYCGDAYKMVDKINSLCGFSQITIPLTEAGLTIVRRNSDRRIFNFL